LKDLNSKLIVISFGIEAEANRSGNKIEGIMANCWQPAEVTKNGEGGGRHKTEGDKNGD
jgi:hypothetical protein